MYTELPISGLCLRELLQAVLEKRCSVRFRAGGWSMGPFIKDGDVVTISPLSGRKLRPGDVVAAPSPGTNGLLLHRVVEIKDGCVVTRGDNLDRTDGHVSLSRLLGRVTRVERAGQKVRLGLGAERFLIAATSRCGRLKPLVVLVRKTVQTIKYWGHG
jgi:signal peptidase I